MCCFGDDVGHPYNRKSVSGFQPSAPHDPFTATLRLRLLAGGALLLKMKGWEAGRLGRGVPGDCFKDARAMIGTLILRAKAHSGDAIVGFLRWGLIMRRVWRRVVLRVEPGRFGRCGRRI
jgi:hypothetical protein